MPASTEMISLREGLERDGAVVCQQLADESTVRALRHAVDSLHSNHHDEAVRERHGRMFAVRNLSVLLPEVNRFAGSEAVKALVRGVLKTDSPVLVRSILFDKQSESNWRVPWHQDTTIAVRERIDAAGFGPWSVKAGVVHVRPPVAVLDSMVTLRLHLDDTDESNGALEVVPGSHRHGLLEADELRSHVESNSSRLCTARAGDALLMKPLVLHASSKSTDPFRRRRVIHLEFAGVDLPAGLAWCEAN